MKFFKEKGLLPCGKRHVVLREISPLCRLATILKGETTTGIIEAYR